MPLSAARQERPRRPRRAPGRRSVGWILALIAAFAAGTPPLLYAHPMLRRSVPAAGDTVREPPRELRLTFSKPIQLSLSSIALLGPGDRAIRLSVLSAEKGDPSVLTVAIMDSPPPGLYTVTWTVAGSDGHPVRGRFTFTVVRPPPADTAPPRGGEAGAGITAPGQAPPPAEHHPEAAFPEHDRFGVESPAYVAVRWLGFASLLGIIGVVGFECLVIRMVRRREAPGGEPALTLARARAARLGVAAAGLLLVAVAGRLVAQSAAMHEPGEALDAALLSAMLFRTMWGWGWLIQLTAATFALWAFLRVRRVPERSWWAPLLAALVLSVTPALAGHAIAVTGYGPLPVLADSLHVLGAGGWLGTLLVVMVAGLPAAAQLEPGMRGPLVAAFVNAFSPVALFFAGLVATTGVFTAWLHLGSVAELWQSAYGRTLLVKLAVLGVVAATGFYNWRRVRPVLGGDVGAHRIRRSSTAELTAAAVVILVTAVLVATPPSGEENSVATLEAPPVPTSTSSPTEVLP